LSSSFRFRDPSLDDVPGGAEWLVGIEADDLHPPPGRRLAAATGEKRAMYFVACATPGVASTVDSLRSENATPCSMYVRGPM